MTALDQNVQEDTIVDFLQSIETVGGLLKAVAGDKLQAVVEFRPSGRRVLLDLTRDPVQVSVGEQGIDGSTGMAGTPRWAARVLVCSLAWSISPFT